MTLGGREVHVWRASLEPETEAVSRMRQLLSADEQERANRFHFEIDRRHFIVARGCLRTILSRYIGIAPDEIRFRYATHGKPMLANSIEQVPTLRFNLSHSHNLALFGFTRVGEIGVDIEYIRPDFNGDDVARRFFSPAEVACLNEIPPVDRYKAFFSCWTRKEAFVKARKLGLSLALDQFDVSLSPQVPAALLRTRWNEDEASRWSLNAIEVEPGYVAAVAVEGHNWHLTRWQTSTKYFGH
jgi:4'-phosphopantetheinyl transferase